MQTGTVTLVHKTTTTSDLHFLGEEAVALATSRVVLAVWGVGKIPLALFKHMREQKETAGYQIRIQTHIGSPDRGWSSLHLHMAPAQDARTRTPLMGALPDSKSLNNHHQTDAID